MPYLLIKSNFHHNVERTIEDTIICINSDIPTVDELTIILSSMFLNSDEFGEWVWGDKEKFKSDVKSHYNTFIKWLFGTDYLNETITSSQPDLNEMQLFNDDNDGKGNCNICYCVPDGHRYQTTWVDISDVTNQIEDRIHYAKHEMSLEELYESFAMKSMGIIISE